MIEIDTKIDIKAKVFRLFSRDGTASCKRELWCRFDFTENGWVASFYGKFCQNNATCGADKLTDIPSNVADLAIKALEMLTKLNSFPWEDEK
jgi:hypothetical protein